MNAFCFTESRLVKNILHEYFMKANIICEFYAFEDIDIIDYSKVIPDFFVLEEYYSYGNRDALINLIKAKFQSGYEILTLIEENSILLNNADDVNHLLNISSREKLYQGLDNFVKFRNNKVMRSMEHIDAIKRKKQILFIDDSGLQHSIINDFFDSTDYVIKHAYDGLEGFEIIKKEMPSLIITDIEMPEMDGLELCKSIRQLELGASVPIIIVTSIDDENMMKRTFDVGADDYIKKPLTPEVLINKVNGYFNRDKRSEKILIIDDSKMIRSILSHAVVKLGYTVILAEDGQEGYHLACEHNPDIIITDLEMPILDGYGFLEKVRNNKKMKDTPAIIISSLNSRYNKKLGERLDVVKYFVKPFQVDAVMLEIEHLLLEKYRENVLENKYILASIDSLINALEARDHYTLGHTERVTNYATEIAELMFLDIDVINNIELASRLHDIGKIGIRDDVLLKEGRLTDDEFDIIKSHPLKGVEILKPIKSLEAIIDLVRHHHERMDGAGYPDGLKGEEIPIGARIIAVADTFDAITSDRPYRTKQSYESALDIIKDNVGTQFFKEPVDVFEKIVKKMILQRNLNNYKEITKN